MLRRKMLAMPLGAALALLPSLLAAVDDRPQSQPTRDVTVEYRVQGNDGTSDAARPRKIKVYWASSGTLIRIEMADERSYVLLDRDAKQMTIVLLDQRGYVEMPFDPRRLAGLTIPPGVALSRAGTEVVAGNTCTAWLQKSDQGNSLVCVTPDGVLLHAQARTSQLRDELEATSIVYGPLPLSVFTPPADFQKLNPPPGPGSTPGSAAGARPPG